MSRGSGCAIRIRRCRDTDVDAVLSVFHGAVHEGAAREYTPEQRRGWAPDPPDREAWVLRLRRGATFVAVAPIGRVCGFVRVEADGYLDLLYVEPAMQRRGVACSLLRSAGQWAAGQGARRLTAAVSLTARGFFRKAGFLELAEHTVERGGVSLRYVRMIGPMPGDPPGRRVCPRTGEGGPGQ